MTTIPFALEDHASPDLHLNVSRQCGEVPSFGEVLTSILKTRNISQKQFAALIFRSEADVSRLVNNHLPQNFHFEDLHQIRLELNCTKVEFAQLVCSFLCNLLASHGLVELDTDP